MAERSAAGLGIGDVGHGADLGHKGALVIADRVGAKIAHRAALDIDGVISHRTTVGSLLGGSTLLGGVYPAVSIDMSESAPVVDVDLAVSWPTAVAQVCRHVRDHVGDELARLTGVRPAQVNVSVAHIVSEKQVPKSSKGFVEIPAPVEPDAEAEPELASQAGAQTQSRTEESVVKEVSS